MNILTVAGLLLGASLLAWILLGVEDRQERKREAQARHPSQRSMLCACGMFGLNYPEQQLLDRDDDQVHCRDWCGPHTEWLAPGR